MTSDRCEEMRLLLQADFDGELDAGEAAAAAAHVADCPDCAATQRGLAALSARLRTELPTHAAPPGLRQTVEAAIAARTAVPQQRDPRRLPRRWLQRTGMRLGPVLPFGAGLAVAASLALVLLPHAGDVADGVVASHIRALQPGHLTDVVSTDRHTVKPWFDGRLDYAPPVKDLAAEGFPLVGGRLDYLSGRPVAALAYRRAQHVIDLYVWPQSAGVDTVPHGGERNGYNFERWTDDGMVFWAVSDLNRKELRSFVERWRAAT